MADPAKGTTTLKTEGKKKYLLLKSVKMDGTFYYPNKKGQEPKVVELDSASVQPYLLEKGFLKEVK